MKCYIGPQIWKECMGKRKPRKIVTGFYMWNVSSLYSYRAGSLMTVANIY
jgi:hypothetical protein